MVGQLPTHEVEYVSISKYTFNPHSRKIKQLCNAGYSYASSENNDIIVNSDLLYIVLTLRLGGLSC